MDDGFYIVDAKAYIVDSQVRSIPSARVMHCNNVTLHTVEHTIRVTGNRNSGIGIAGDSMLPSTASTPTASSHAATRNLYENLAQPKLQRRRHLPFPPIYLLRHLVMLHAAACGA
jgi:hypothetical protein